METLENMLKPYFLMIIVYSTAPPIEISWARELSICLLMQNAMYQSNLEPTPLRKKQIPRDQLWDSEQDIAC